MLVFDPAPHAHLNDKTGAGDRQQRQLVMQADTALLAKSWLT